MSTAAHPPSMRKAIAAGMMGNVMEWYDFGLYGFFAPILADLFFPAADDVAALMNTFGVFAAGFLMRPIGAAVFGHFGDRIGRKKTLAASVILMAVPTGLIGLLPTHAQAGELAPILLTVMRLLQGTSVGGEFTGSITYLVEHSPPGRRGLIGSLPVISAVLGTLLGSGVGALLTTILTEAELKEWAWRLPFLAGVLIGVVGLYMRLGIEETPRFMAAVQASEIVRFPLFVAVRQFWREIATVCGFLWLQSVSFYMLFVWMTSYLKDEIGFSFHDALMLTTIAMLLSAFVLPVSALLSDRIGRKPPLIGAALGFLVLAYPLFLLLSSGDYGRTLAALCVCAVLQSVLVGPIPTTLVEIFPTRARYTSLSLGYNLALAVFGGSAPLVSTWLIQTTHNRIFPAYYLMLSAAVTAALLCTIRETYRDELK